MKAVSFANIRYFLSTPSKHGLNLLEVITEVRQKASAALNLSSFMLLCREPLSVSTRGHPNSEPKASNRPARASKDCGVNVE
jgi:hypothetical protein